jgi:hypothetical protein
MPGLLPSMMWPLFPLPLSGQPSPSLTSSPPNREAHPQHPPPSDLFSLASSASPIISSMRDKGKVSILCSLHDITSETHLLMFDGMTSAVPRLISPPRAAGDSHTSSP